MKEEEAKNYLKSTGMSDEQIRTVVDAFTCEDAISRQAVLALAEKGTLVSNGNYKSVSKAINELPSVTPKPKTGHWIKHDNGAWWECSECHAERAYGNEYCPDCGSHNGDIAKMVEPQESEG